MIAMTTESSKAREGNPKEVDVDELLKNLNLHGEELNEVVLAKEVVKGWPEVKWSLLGNMLLVAHENRYSVAHMTCATEDTPLKWNFCGACSYAPQKSGYQWRIHLYAP